MKAKVIRKLRKQIQAKGYIFSRMEKLAAVCRKWNTFFYHECDSFYVGEEQAYINKLRYNKYGIRDKKKFQYYKIKLEQNEKP